MLNTIQKYQDAFNSVIERLKKNDSVLAVMVFGSIITGDLWEESDIDLFVISKDNINGMRNIYTEEKDVPVHIKLMSKERLLHLHKEDIVGGFIHRVFVSSRLVFSKDEEITVRYDIGRYYPDVDREKWNMVYIGNLLKSMSICKKYLNMGNIHMAYSETIKCIEDFSKLYVNSSGYMISKDVITMAMNLNDSLKEYVDKLFFNKDNLEHYVEEIIDFFQDNINQNLKKYTTLLLDYMTKKDCFLSSEDMKKDEFFKNFKIDFENILNKLWEKKIIKKESREYKDDSNNTLFKEKVYFI
ncbi:nucleotidyltransferase domain-containing protein [Clostridium ganghwense]|uniref:Nucleotidyltransferase domain-containing protein n=1 Tax=Clostridium ganghwense TaxID=312089 RepID=A0ABT4CN42_9CLOT|nr:nucleotidyltransferase domain-containing protein [Clostridium ganghwense]MCY6370476.1 nucleotidyltransferase domain-containing protein [Clostridium ganghwense]